MKKALKLAREHIAGNYTVSAEEALAAIDKALAQPERTWVGLTEAEANNIYKGASTFGEMMRMVEARLKELNT